MERAAEMHWTPQGEGVFTGWCGPWWPARRFVIVEAVPAGDEDGATREGMTWEGTTWDWAAWMGDRSGPGMSGTAPTLDRAMREAEWAARQLGPEKGLQAGGARPT